MTRRKKTPAGYFAPPLSAHEAGKISPHGVSYSSAPADSLADNSPEEEQAAVAPLTVREAEMLADIADGQNNLEICRRRKVALATVEKHIENIYRKLGVTNRADAAIWFLKRRLAEKDRRIEELERRLAALGG